MVSELFALVSLDPPRVLGSYVVRDRTLTAEHRTRHLVGQNETVSVPVKAGGGRMARAAGCTRNQGPTVRHPRSFMRPAAGIPSITASASSASPTSSPSAISRL